ncbi:MAG: hypothetical protein IJW93_05830 [Clostridia bacterium]|nr:hypothetical protein [Clostridia bacterium]
MRNKLKSRKGATLAELVIVLAVVVIAAGMVVSFSSMMHGAQGISNARHEALQDVRVAEALIESFIENNVEEATKIQLENGTLTFTKGENDSEKTATIKFHDNIHYIILRNFDGETTSLELEKIDSISFVLYADSSVVNNDNFADRDTLYYCTVNYSVGDTPYTYTFCVNPYAGEGGT